MADVVRIGILGAARIAPVALVRPGRQVPEVEVVAVAARDEQRARRFATRHRIPRVHRSYEELLADPGIDAIYNPLPNGLHCEWTLKAFEAGKHVLCEKPLASNEAEAARMAEAAERSGLLLGEAFHWRYHPLAARMREILESGELGEPRHVEASLCIPLPLPGDIRYRYELGGGALMDTGCYAVSMVRFLAGAEPDVASAEVRLSSDKVDRWARAELRFPHGPSGRVTCSLFSAQLLKIQALVVGSRGMLSVFNPIAPHIYHHLSVDIDGRRRRERVKGDATYTHQLRAFASWVQGGPPMPTDGAHGVANMRVIDAIYRAAGLPLRGEET